MFAFHQSTYPQIYYLEFYDIPMGSFLRLASFGKRAVPSTRLLPLGKLMGTVDKYSEKLGGGGEKKRNLTFCTYHAVPGGHRGRIVYYSWRAACSIVSSFWGIDGLDCIIGLSSGELEFRAKIFEIFIRCFRMRCKCIETATIIYQV